MSPRTYVHDVAAAFDIILKYGFHLPIEETATSHKSDWQETIQETGNRKSGFD